MPASPGSARRLRRISAAATSVAARSASVACTRGSSADAINARAAACGSPRRACSSTSLRQAMPASGPGPASSMQVCKAAEGAVLVPLALANGCQPVGDLGARRPRRRRGQRLTQRDQLAHRAGVRVFQAGWLGRSRPPAQQHPMPVHRRHVQAHARRWRAAGIPRRRRPRPARRPADRVCPARRSPVAPARRPTAAAARPPRARRPRSRRERSGPGPPRPARGLRRPTP